MKSNQKLSSQRQPDIYRKSAGNTAAVITAIAISRKLMEIKRISGDGEMTELNLALFRHLK